MCNEDKGYHYSSGTLNLQCVAAGAVLSEGVSVISETAVSSTTDFLGAARARDPTTAFELLNQFPRVDLSAEFRWNQSQWVEWPTMVPAKPLHCGSTAPTVKNWAYFDNECGFDHDGVSNPKSWAIPDAVGGDHSRVLGEELHPHTERLGTFCVWVKLAENFTEGVIWQTRANDSAPRWQMAKLTDNVLEARVREGAGQVRFDYSNAGEPIDGMGSPHKNGSSWQHLCYTWQQTGREAADTGGATEDDVAEFYVNGNDARGKYEFYVNGNDARGKYDPITSRTSRGHHSQFYVNGNDARGKYEFYVNGNDARGKYDPITSRTSRGHHSQFYVNGNNARGKYDL